MQGLPPPPAGVLEVRWIYDIDGTPASVGQWIAVPGSEFATIDELRTPLAQLIFFWLDLSSGLSHLGTQVVRVEVERWGSAPLRFSRPVADNHGAFTGGQVATAASVLHWYNGRVGRSGPAISFIPGLPDFATENHSSVRPQWFVLLLQRGLTYLQNVDAIAGIGSGTCLHGSLQRSEGGVPLGASRFLPTLAAGASWRVGSLQRRRILPR